MALVSLQRRFRYAFIPFVITGTQSSYLPQDHIDRVRSRIVQFDEVVNMSSGELHVYDVLVTLILVPQIGLLMESSIRLWIRSFLS